MFKWINFIGFLQLFPNFESDTCNMFQNTYMSTSLEVYLYNVPQKLVIFAKYLYYSHLSSTAGSDKSN